MVSSPLQGSRVDSCLTGNVYAVMPQVDLWTVVWEWMPKSLVVFL